MKWITLFNLINTGNQSGPRGIQEDKQSSITYTEIYRVY